MTMPMSSTTRPFDAARYIETEEGVVALLESAMESGDAEHIGNAFGIVARCDGLKEIAARMGVGSDDLIDALAAARGASHDDFAAPLAVLGLELKIERKAA